VGGLLLGGRGRLTSATHRRKAFDLISEAPAAVAGLLSACDEINICLRTLKRWRKALIGDDGCHCHRKGSHRLISHKLSEEERQRLQHQAEYVSLPPGQSCQPDRSRAVQLLRRRLRLRLRKKLLPGAP